MAKTLERFTLTRAADDFLLTIEDDQGDTVELIVTVDQLDLMTEELDRAMEEDEVAALDDDTDESDDHEDDD